MPRLRTAALATLVGVSALTGFAAFAPSASAHVSVASSDAKPGGYAVVTFRVPNEEANATTTKLQVQLPSDTPFAFAATQPIPGWTAVETKTKLAKPITTDDGSITEGISQITWTATSAAAIKPGQFQEFDVQLGPLPDKSSVTFPAIQTYSDGQVVRWIEKQAPGSSEEPDHPAPVLTLTGASSTPSTGASATVASQPSAGPASSSSNTGPIVLSIIALVLAAGALGMTFVNRARRSS